MYYFHKYLLCVQMSHLKHGGCGFSSWTLKTFCSINLGPQWLCGWRPHKVLDWDFISLSAGAVAAWL